MALSHAKDKPIAAALQAVQKLDKPWYRRRALRVFRAPPWQLPPASSFRGYFKEYRAQGAVMRPGAKGPAEAGGRRRQCAWLLNARYIDGYTGKPPLQK